MKTILSLIGLATVAASLHAQKPSRPAWTIRLDGAAHRSTGDTTLSLETMPPGWHVTTGRNSGLYYDPGWRASGNYRLEATVFLFPDSREEGYGLFLGGRDLAGDNGSYLYFLLRRDGKYLIKHRQGADTHEITPWTAHPSIGQPKEEPAKNVIAIVVGPTQIGLEVNGQPVATLDRRVVTAPLDGQVGLRLNHGINLHVTAVKVVPAG